MAPKMCVSILGINPLLIVVPLMSNACLEQDLSVLLGVSKGYLSFVEDK